MPIYEYRCGECEHVFEELVPAKRRAGVRCPKCDSKRVELALSVFSAHAASTPQKAPVGGCGRCGDPNGPCQFD